MVKMAFLDSYYLKEWKRGHLDAFPLWISLGYSYRDTVSFVKSLLIPLLLVSSKRLFIVLIY